MDPFATLGIERSFDVDLSALERTHRELSRALHPDKFVAAGASERREALARAVEVNEAFRVVRDPIKRAEALFALCGVPVGEDKEPKPSPDFLMEMMEEREGLSEARQKRDVARVRELGRGIEARAEACERAIARGFQENKPDVRRLGELRFYRRYLEEVSAFEEEIDGAA